MDRIANIHSLAQRTDRATWTFWFGVHAFLPSIPLAALMRSPWRTLSRKRVQQPSATVLYHPTAGQVGARHSH